MIKEGQKYAQIYKAFHTYQDTDLTACNGLTTNQLGNVVDHSSSHL